MIRVTVWNEFVHEREHEEIRAVYPDGIHNCIKEFLECDDIVVRTANLFMPEHGLTQEVLDDTDVLIWWGHMAHHLVSDEVVARVQKRIWEGMGMIVLHSGHHSKIFRTMLGTSCNLKWRDDDRERIWVVKPSHPIAQGIPEHFEIEKEEMYGEPFDIPTPEDVVFMGWFAGGEVFRSGVTYTRGNGRIFYFQPGHESNPVYRHPVVQQVIRNAVVWACPTKKYEVSCPNFPSLEE